MTTIPSVESEKKKVVTMQSKRATWNTTRKYNYKYITTIF